MLYIYFNTPNHLPKLNSRLSGCNTYLVTWKKWSHCVIKITLYRKTFLTSLQTFDMKFSTIYASITIVYNIFTLIAGYIGMRERKKNYLYLPKYKKKKKKLAGRVENIFKCVFIFHVCIYMYNIHKSVTAGRFLNTRRRVTICTT